MAASGNRAVIDNTEKSQTRAFGDWVRNKISSKDAAPAPVATAPAPATSYDPIEKLERLGKLKESGVLTEEEFQTQKKAILATM